MLILLNQLKLLIIVHNINNININKHKRDVINIRKNNNNNNYKLDNNSFYIINNNNMNILTNDTNNNAINVNINNDNMFLFKTYVIIKKQANTNIII